MCLQHKGVNGCSSCGFTCVISVWLCLWILWLSSSRALWLQISSSGLGSNGLHVIWITISPGILLHCQWLLHYIFGDIFILGEVHSEYKCFDSTTKINASIFFELWQLLMKWCSTNKQHWVSGISFSSSIKVFKLITHKKIANPIKFKSIKAEIWVDVTNWIMFAT